MSDIAIQVTGLGKKYRVARKARTGSETLGGHLAQAAASFWGRVRELAGGGVPGGGSQEFWALRDVSFDVKQGEVLGVVGHNGAGKSTLLKLLSRITDPTEGSASIHGRVASLLEVGTGFHEELSGRDNVYFSGSILGMPRGEIARRFDEIVEFAGVREFIDTPIKRYSSGMKLRLGFAVAAHLEPEILIVDEVLAVGDAAFQKRCVEKMGDVSSHGRTVLVVSHSLDLVRRLTTRCLLLEHGRVVAHGATESVVGDYLRRAITNEAQRAGLRDMISRPDKAVKLVGFAARMPTGADASTCTMGDTLVLGVDCEMLRDMDDVHVIVRISTFDGRAVHEFVSADGGRAVRAPRGAFHAEARLERVMLYPGLYKVSVTILDSGSNMPHAHVDSALTLQVVGGAYPPIVRPLDTRFGLVYEPAEWAFATGGAPA